MSTRPATWKILTFGAALAGLGVAGAGAAGADDEPRGQQPDSVVVDAPGDATAAATPADVSPESADSPNESVTDSPDDVAPADASPESADSPAESAWDSADDTPDD